MMDRHSQTCLLGLSPKDSDYVVIWRELNGNWRWRRMNVQGAVVSESRAVHIDEVWEYQVAIANAQTMNGDLKTPRFSVEG